MKRGLAWWDRLMDKQVTPLRLLLIIFGMFTAIALLAAACGSSKTGAGTGGTSNVSVGTVTTDRGTFTCAESSSGGLSCDWDHPNGGTG